MGGFVVCFGLGVLFGFFDCLGLVCLGFLVCVFLGSFLSIAENLRTEAVLAMVCLKEILIS